MRISPSSDFIDTGITWIGSVPSDWKMVSIKSIAKIILGKMRQDKPASEEDTLEKYLCAKDVHLDGINWYEPKEMYFSPNEKRALLVKDGDLLIVEGGAGAGGAFVAQNPTEEKYYVQNSINIVRAHKCVLPQYLYYWINKLVTNGYVEVACNVATIPHFTKEKVSSVQIPLPPLDTQRRIVTYLDSHVTSIDKRVSLLATKRNHYLRLKTAIINRAVTQGLNERGNTPKKVRLKDISKINALSLPESTSANYVFRYIDISNVSWECGISLSEPLSFFDAPSRARRIVRKNDIMISTVRTYLKAIGIISWDAQDIIASTGFAVLTPGKKVFPKFLSYAVTSNFFVDQICKRSVGVSYPAIASSEIGLIEIPFFSLSEQQAIATYLDEKCTKIDAIVENLNQQIEKHKLLKRALINEVITGQRAV